jgi:hypothetical protein
MYIDCITLHCYIGYISNGEHNMTTIESNTFAEACFNQNSIEELEQALKDGPDATDMQTWGLTADEWREQIELALKARKEAETDD